MKSYYRVAPLVLLLALCLTGRAEIRFGSVFTDHAVLQRDLPVEILGDCDAGEGVAALSCHGRPAHESGQTAHDYMEHSGSANLRTGPVLHRQSGDWRSQVFSPPFLSVPLQLGCGRSPR